MPMDSITFRTDDPTRWGTGNGSDLTAAQIDINFWVLYTTVIALQDHFDSNGAGISYFIVNGDQFTVMLTNHVALGPYNLPVAAFNFRGEWEANQTYNINDVFTQDGAIYMVIWPLANSGATFFAGSNDGMGHDYYALMLASPASELPTGATNNQVLRWNAESPAESQWVSLTRNLAIYLETEPNPLEEVLRYMCPETMTFPAGLTGSVASAANAPTTAQTYELYWNGAAVGSITFSASPEEVTFSFPHEITLEAGDILSIVAPSVPDPHMDFISITLVGTLT